MNFAGPLLDFLSLTSSYSSASTSLYATNAASIYQQRSLLGASYLNQNFTEFESRDYSQSQSQSQSPLDQFDISLIQSLYNPSNSHEADYLKSVGTILNHIPDISAPVSIGYLGAKMSALEIVCENPKTFDVLRGTLDRPEYLSLFESIESLILTTDTTTFKWIDTHLEPMCLFKSNIQKDFVKVVDQVLMEHRKSLGAEYVLELNAEKSAVCYTKHISIKNYPNAELLEFDIYLSKGLQIIFEKQIKNSNFDDVLFRHISNYNLELEPKSSVRSCLLLRPRGRNVDLSHPDYINHFTESFDQFVIYASSEVGSAGESAAIDEINDSFKFLELFGWENVQKAIWELNEKFKIHRVALGGGYNKIGAYVSEHDERFQATIVAAYNECTVEGRKVVGSLAHFDYRIIQLFNKIFDLDSNSRRRGTYDLLKRFLINHIADFYTETGTENGVVTDITVLERVLSYEDYVVSHHLFRLPDYAHYFKDFLGKILEKDAVWLEGRLGFFHKFSKEIQASAIKDLDLQIKQHRDTLIDDPVKEEEFEVSLMDGVKIVLSSEGRRTCSNLVKMLCDNISDLSARFGGSASEQKDSVFSLLLNSRSSDLDFFRGSFEYSNYMKYYKVLFDDILGESVDDDHLDDLIVAVRSLQFFTVKIQQSVAADLSKAIRSHRKGLGAVYFEDGNGNGKEEVTCYESRDVSEALISFDTHLVKMFGIIAKHKEARIISDCLLNHIPDFDFEGVDTKNNNNNNNNPISSVFGVIEREKLHKQYADMFKRAEFKEYFKKFITCVDSKSASNLKSFFERVLLFDSTVQVEIIAFIGELIREHRSGLGADYYCNESESDCQVTVYAKRDINDIELRNHTTQTKALESMLLCFDFALLEAFKIVVESKNQKYFQLIKMLLNHISDPITNLPNTETSALSLLYSNFIEKNYQNGVAIKNLAGKIDRPDLKIYFFAYITEKLFAVKKYPDWSLQFFLPLYFMTPAIVDAILGNLDSYIRYNRIEFGAKYTEIGDRFIADYNNIQESSDLETFDETLSNMCKDKLSGGVARVVLNNVPKLIEDETVQKSLCENTCLSGKIGHSEAGKYLVKKLIDYNFDQNAVKMFINLFKLFDPELRAETIKLLNEQIYDRRIKLGGSYVNNDSVVVSVYEERRFIFLFPPFKRGNLPLNPKTNLVHLDFCILYFLKAVSDMRNFDNLALFKMVLNHIPDLKATFYDDNFSALSLIGTKKFLLQHMRGTVHREEAEISVYFESFLKGPEGSKRGDLWVDTDLLALALFTPEIQRSVISKFITNFPNTKNLLLHLVLFYRLDKRVFFDLIEAGAQLLVLSKEDYENSNNVSKEDIIFAKSDSYIPADAFDESCHNNNKMMYVDYDLFTNQIGAQSQMIESCKETFPDNNEGNFRCGMGEMHYLPEASSLRAAFNNYDSDVVLKLMEMSSSYQNHQTRYNLAYLIVKNPTRYANLPPIEELVDREAAIERFNSGTPEIISIALLSKLTGQSDFLNSDSVVKFFTEKLHVGEKEKMYVLASGKCKGGNGSDDVVDKDKDKDKDKEYLKSQGLFYLPNDTLKDIILTACRYNLPDDAFSMLVEVAFIKLQNSTARNIFKSALEIAKDINNESKMKILHEKIEWIKKQGGREGTCFSDNEWTCFSF